MSDLQDIGRQVTEVARDINQWAAQLESSGAGLRRAATQAAAATRESPGAGRIAAALDAAARQCQQAASTLVAAKSAAEQFVARNVGGSSGEGRAAGGGAGLDRQSGGTGAVPSAGSVAAWVGQVNPGYTGSPFDPRSTNCGQCALAVFRRLSGEANATAGAGTLSTSQMEQATGRSQRPMDPSAIRQRLIEMGPGSHAVVGIDRESYSGHWFNAYYDGSEVVAIDGQSGTVSPWPPEYGSRDHPVVRWDANV